MKKVEAWTAFAAAAIIDPNIGSVDQAAAIADEMLTEWDNRFGDGKFFLDGQKECAACHQPLGAEYVISDDNLKFCNSACRQAAGRGPNLGCESCGLGGNTHTANCPKANPSIGDDDGAA